MRFHEISFTATLLALSFGLPLNAKAAPKACELIDPQQFSAIVGGKVSTQVTLDSPQNGSMCDLKSPNSSIYVTVAIDELAKSPYGASTMTSIVKEGFKPVNGETAAAVPNLGELNALKIANNGYMTEVLVLYHGFFVTINAHAKPSPAITAAVIQAARQALTKL